MTDIQRARDVLAKWCEGSTGAWRIDALTHIGDVYLDDGVMLAGDQPLDRARLIVGTAGNPELLDAIDGLLELALTYGDLPPGSGSRFITRAERIATAIIAADERMSA